MLFGDCLYPYLVNFVGKGIVCIDCWGKKTWFQFYVLKKMYGYLDVLSIVLGVLHALLHLIKQKSMRNVLSTFPFYRWKNWG